MSPRTGRPIKGSAKRDKRLEVRLTAEEYQDIQEVADSLNLSKADTIVKGVQLLKSEK